MALVEDLKDARYGTVQAKAVYVGAEKVWPPPVWTPADIPGLTAWIDASQDSFPDGQVVVTGLPDHSPSGRTYLTTGGFGPRFRASLGGRPAYEWIDTATYGLDAGTLNPGTTGLTYLFVGRITGGNYPMMVVWGPDADGIEMRHDGSQMQIVILYGSYGIVYSFGGATQDGNERLFALRVAPGVSHAWVNSNKGAGAGPAAMPNVTRPLFIARRQGGYPFVGPMREVLVYAGPVSDVDMNVLWLYLQAKWGL